MKQKIKVFVSVISLLFLFSCGGYETQVINTIHSDGSVTRKVIVKNKKNDFSFDKFKVPVDSTWQSKITYEISAEEDTVWIYTALKEFKSAEAINLAYRADSGTNRDLPRTAFFTKSFRWFTTVYRFTEKVDKTLTIDCPMSDFFSEKEAEFMYMPDFVQEDLKTGSDSLAYTALADSADSKSEFWLTTSLVKQWTQLLDGLLENNPGVDSTMQVLREHEDQLARQITFLDADDDSILIATVGERFFNEHKTEIDSANSLLEKVSGPFWDVESYDMETRMPGKLISTNGYIQSVNDSTDIQSVSWTVKGEFFLTQPFEMWAESKVTNYWAWVVSGLFILFVIAGFVIKRRN